MGVTPRACGVALAMFVCGCASTQDRGPTTSTSTEQMQSTAASAPVSKSGISVVCPAGWKTIQKGGDDMLAAVPEKSAGGENDPILEVHVPNLPPHIPGFLPLGGVADGYVQDLKKRYPDQKVDERSMVKLDGADARRLASSFQNHGKAWRELALLAVHGDHVYVIVGNCDASAFDKTKAAFDALVTSVKWTEN